MIHLSIANDFTKTPGFRYETQSPGISGQLFRTKKLQVLYEQALLSNERLIVNLDGTAGYLTSFLEEAFGGLQREYRNKGMRCNILDNIDIVSTVEPHWVADIKRYVDKEIAKYR